MKSLVFIPALAALLFAGACATGNHPMKDSPSIEGNWTCISAVVDGNPLPDETAKQLRLTITRDRYKTEKGDQTLFDSTYTTDPIQTPKQINIVGTEGALAGKVGQGIYAIDGDRLQICYTMPSNNRPASFQSDKGSKAYLTMWKRE